MEELLRWFIRITLFVLFFGGIYVFKVKVRKLREQMSSEDMQCDTDSHSSDIKIAIDSLVGMGWSKKEASDMVNAAFVENPDGDYTVLVNLAIKK